MFLHTNEGDTVPILVRWAVSVGEKLPEVGLYV
jgi:hypothetical protein